MRNSVTDIVSLPVQEFSQRGNAYIKWCVQAHGNAAALFAPAQAAAESGAPDSTTVQPEPRAQADEGGSRSAPPPPQQRAQLRADLAAFLADVDACAQLLADGMADGDAALAELQAALESNGTGAGSTGMAANAGELCSAACTSSTGEHGSSGCRPRQHEAFQGAEAAASPVLVAPDDSGNGRGAERSWPSDNAQQAAELTLPACSHLSSRHASDTGSGAHAIGNAPRRDQADVASEATNAVDLEVADLHDSSETQLQNAAAQVQAANARAAQLQEQLAELQRKLRDANLTRMSDVVARSREVAHWRAQLAELEAALAAALAARCASVATSASLACFRTRTPGTGRSITCACDPSIALSGCLRLQLACLSGTLLHDSVAALAGAQPTCAPRQRRTTCRLRSERSLT
jgi:hypothetical protein